MVARKEKLTRRQQRLAEKGQAKSLTKTQTLKQQHFDLAEIYPLTENQNLTFESYQKGDHLFLLGAAGTGKSFLTMYLSLRELLEEKTKRRRLVIIRTAQATKQIGHLPGTEKEKIEAYEAPYKQICADLFNRDDAYEILKQKGIVEFHSTSFLRGTTIDDAVILVDEIQNMGYQEFRTVLTRTGENSRILLCGDTKQDDLTSKRYNENSGLKDIMRVFDRMNMLTKVEFTINDIVRSGFVKDFLIAEHELGMY